MRLIIGYFAAIGLLLGGLYSFGSARANSAHAQPAHINSPAPEGLTLTRDEVSLIGADMPVESYAL